jgi:hypothetical protein
MGTGMGMGMGMEGNGCLSFGIVVMGIFRIYLLWGICILVEGERKGWCIWPIVYLFGDTILQILVLGRMYVNWIYL